VISCESLNYRQSSFPLVPSRLIMNFPLKNIFSNFFLLTVYNSSPYRMLCACHSCLLHYFTCSIENVHKSFKLASATVPWLCSTSWRVPISPLQQTDWERPNYLAFYLSTFHHRVLHFSKEWKTVEMELSWNYACIIVKDSLFKFIEIIFSFFHLE
jgi:hypothetical protein